MCGIFLSIGFEEVTVEVIDSVIHRGPDGRGYNQFRSTYGSVVMAHRRLSIIDLSSAGHQPMSAKDGRYWITYNGEIYNYLEIRKELETLGYTFETHTDTEVLLNSYIHWGAGCLDKFNGMFAFAIWDTKEERGFIARDRFGVKPLYYYRDGDRFAFASEIKQFTSLLGFQSKLNKSYFCSFVSKKLHPIGDVTLFENVKHLEPGHYGTFSQGGFSLHNWYDLPIVDKNSPQKVSSDDFYPLFLDSIQKRLISDVPTGALLSGGLDSSSIVCMIAEDLKTNKQNIRRPITFTSWAEDIEVDEREYSDAVIDKTRLTNIQAKIEESTFQSQIESIIYHQEEPFVNTSLFSEWNIYSSIKQHTDLKVVLDGQGADEMLCGYMFMIPYVLAEHVKRYRYFTFFCELFYIKKNHPKINISTLLWDVVIQVCPSLIAAIQNFRGRDFKKDDTMRFKTFTQYTKYLIRHSIEPQLRWQDRTSMAFSIESRQPFLDYRVIELLLNLPLKQKFKNGVTKIFLRKAMRQILPEKVRCRMSKFGFPSPQKTLLNSIDRAYFLRYSQIGQSIINEVCGRSEEKKTLEDACLEFTIGLWVEKFKVSL